MTFGSFGDGGLEAFNSNAEEIERLLGELAGLDTAARWCAANSPTIGVIGADVEWKVPSRTHPFTIVVGVNDATREDPVAWVQEQLQECWDIGARWSSGIADQIQRYGKMYGDVKVTSLRDLAEEIETQIALKMDGALTSNWSANAGRGTSLEKTLSNFQGEFAGKLHGFYTNVGDRVNNWAVFASSVAAGYAGTAAVIDVCQHDMVEWASKTRKHCEDQLKNWADSGGFGTLVLQNGSGGVSAVETIATLSQIVTFGASVASLFPPAAPVAGTVRTVSGIVGTIVGLADSPTERPVTFNAMSALDIWGWEDSGSGASHELGSNIIDGCTSALRDLRNRQEGGDPSGTADVATEIDRRHGDGEWFAPRPTGVSNPGENDIFYA